MDAPAEHERRAKDIFSALDCYESGYKAYLETPESVKIARKLERDDPNVEINPRKRIRSIQEGFDYEQESELMDNTGESKENPTQDSKKLFLRESSKWTEYSLEDVTEEQMSDPGFRRAYFDFMKTQGWTEEQMDEGEFDPKSVFGHLVKKKQEFKKPKPVQPLDKKSFAYRFENELDNNEMS